MIFALFNQRHSEYVVCAEGRGVEGRGIRISKRANSFRDVLEDKPGWQSKNCFVQTVYCNGHQNSLTTELFLDLCADCGETIDPTGR